MNKMCTLYWKKIAAARRGIVGFAVLALLMKISLTLSLAAGVAAKLDTSDGSTSFEVKDSAGITVGRVDSDGNMILVGSATVQNGLILDSGRVGVGTQLPDAQFHQSAAAGTAGPRMIVSTGATKLFEVNGASIVTNVPLRFADGTAQYTAFTGATGLDLTGSTQTKLGGANMMGRLGVGTTSPATQLHLKGALTLEEPDYSNSGTVDLVSYGVGQGFLRMVAGGTSGKIFEVRDCCNDILSVAPTGGTSSFRDSLQIGSNLYTLGLTGLGTASPSAKLHSFSAAGTGGPQVIIATGTTKLFEVNGASIVLSVPVTFPDGTIQTGAGITASSVDTLTNKTLGAGTIYTALNSNLVVGLTTAAKETNATIAGTQEVVGSTQTQTLTNKTFGAGTVYGTHLHGAQDVVGLSTAAKEFNATIAGTQQVVGSTQTQTLTNKTLGAGTIYTALNSNLVVGLTTAAKETNATIAGTQQVVGSTQTQTLTNKTLGAGTIYTALNSNLVVGLTTAAKETNATIAGTQQVVGSTQTQTLTNKTFGAGTVYGTHLHGAQDVVGLSTAAKEFNAAIAGTQEVVGSTQTQTLTNKTIGTTGLVFNGPVTDVTTGTNEHFAIMPNGAGMVGIGTLTPTANLYVVGTSSVTGKVVGLNTSNQIYAVYAP